MQPFYALEILLEQSSVCDIFAVDKAELGSLNGKSK